MKVLLLVLEVEVKTVANIVIKDLEESVELDRKAMAKIVGGRARFPLGQGGLKYSNEQSLMSPLRLRKPTGVWPAVLSS